MRVHVNFKQLETLLTRYLHCRSNSLVTTLQTKRDEITDEWRRLHDEELYDLYFSPNIIRLFMKSVMGWACGGYGLQKGYIKGLERRPGRGGE